MAAAGEGEECVATVLPLKERDRHVRGLVVGQTVLVVLDLAEHRDHGNQQARLGQRGQCRAVITFRKRPSQRGIGRPVVVVEPGEGQAALWLHPSILPGPEPPPLTNPTRSARATLTQASPEGWGSSW